MKKLVTEVKTPEGRAIASFDGPRNNDLIRQTVADWYGGMTAQHAQLVGNVVQHAEYGYQLALITSTEIEVDYDKEKLKADLQARGFRVSPL